ncbi:BTB/POZ/MATH-domain protein [Rhynchospora pubera]|uniref:BTB/POZ/MATH-domain protein n=1 Tax=Rhynchospora pubera TaxID=906938 RepID=A0AAV8H6X8_9POAL|nr:BTB/POZ/MATH-domain protein [Rhynchospora pubera]
MVLNESDEVEDHIASFGAIAMHQIKIRFSKTKDFPAGKCIKFPTFSVAGHNFNFFCYPGGLKRKVGLLAMGLHCMSAATVTFGCTVCNNETRVRTLFKEAITFTPGCNEHSFSLLTESSKLHDGVALLCSVTIVSDSLEEMPKLPFNALLPFSLSDNMTDFLENDVENMSDITFEVDGKLFTAHKAILFARSSVFTAEFFGNKKIIKIKEMKPKIFKAMLHFIYSDSLPDMFDVHLVQNLYRAAVRYKLEGLKKLCADVLKRTVSVDTVISSLALAEEQIYCFELSGLEDVCLRFASRPEILVQLALKTEFVSLMQRVPYLLESLNGYALRDVDFCDLISKKQEPVN